MNLKSKFYNPCILLAKTVYEILFKRYLLEKYHTYHFISRSDFHDFVFIVSWSCVWIFIQKIPPWEIWHVTLQFQIKFFQFCAYFLAKISMKFHSKSTSLRNMTHNTSITNLNSTILSLFLAEISMKSHSKDTSLRNMTYNTWIWNQNSTILAYC